MKSLEQIYLTEVVDPNKPKKWTKRSIIKKFKDHYGADNDIVVHDDLSIHSLRDVDVYSLDAGLKFSHIDGDVTIHGGNPNRVVLPSRMDNSVTVFCDNKTTTLEGLPEIVGRSVYIEMMESSGVRMTPLSSLKGFPREVGNNIILNGLANISNEEYKHLPKTGGYLHIENCNIRNFTNLPRTIKYDLEVRLCENIESFEGLPEIGVDLIISMWPHRFKMFKTGDAQIQKDIILDHLTDIEAGKKVGGSIVIINATNSDVIVRIDDHNRHLISKEYRAALNQGREETGLDLDI